MNWARRQAAKKGLNEVLVRCKNARHADKRKRVMDRETRKEQKGLL